MIMLIKVSQIILTLLDTELQIFPSLLFVFLATLKLTLIVRFFSLSWPAGVPPISSVSCPCGGETWLKAAVAAVVWIGARCMIHPRAAATEQLSCDKNTICHASALIVKDFLFSDDSKKFFLSGC